MKSLLLNYIENNNLPFKWDNFSRCFDSLGRLSLNSLKTETVSRHTRQTAFHKFQCFFLSDTFKWKFYVLISISSVHFKEDNDHTNMHLQCVPQSVIVSIVNQI